MCECVSCVYVYCYELLILQIVSVSQAMNVLTQARLADLIWDDTCCGHS